MAHFKEKILLIQKWTEPDEIMACDSSLIGCGGCSGNEYFAAKFPGSVLEQAGHISALELLTVVVSLKLWANRLSGKRIQIFCDNQASVAALNSGRTKNQYMNECLRELAFLAVTHDFDIRATYIKSVENRVPDLLSRWYLPGKARQEFFALAGRPQVEIHVQDSLFYNSCVWQ